MYKRILEGSQGTTTGPSGYVVNSARNNDRVPNLGT